MPTEIAVFGHLPDGRAVHRITLANRHGLGAAILDLGATLQAMFVPDRASVLADVTLGHADVAGYLGSPGYFGASIGRVANRIARGRFRLDGVDYPLPRNEPAATLHGGPEGFDKRLWMIVDAGADRVTLALTSPDGDQGFPGRLDVTASWALGDDDVLSIDYRATCDRPTLVALTNHAYWNLAGEGCGDTRQHVLTIDADAFTPVGPGLIPTGELWSVAGTPFDFRGGRALGAALSADDEQLRRGDGYDHNWVVGGSGMRRLARLDAPDSGRRLELWSDQPGLQVYGGNFLDGSIAGKAGRGYARWGGVALEAQALPDTANRPAFGSIRLAPGEIYRNRIEFRFGIVA